MTESHFLISHVHFKIRQEEKSDAAAIEALLDIAFGDNRRLKTTYQFREGVSQINDLCFVALDNQEKLVGTIRFWPVLTSAGERVLLLGPLAVDADFTGHRCGLALMNVGIEAARESGEKLVLLIGDQIYYGKAGFSRVPAGHLGFPGPVDEERILALELEPLSLENAAGKLLPFKA